MSLDLSLSAFALESALGGAGDGPANTHTLTLPAVPPAHNGLVLLAAADAADAGVAVSTRGAPAFTLTFTLAR